MKTAIFVILCINTMWGMPLRADPTESPQLVRHEKNLAKLQAGRRDDLKQTRQAKMEFRKGADELSNHAEQQRQDVKELESVETQVKAGRMQDVITRKSYKEAKQRFGSDDPRSAKAKENWKESREATDLLGENRRLLKEDIHKGDRLVHNEKTVLSVQQRTMDSNARYRASDDREIVKEEKNIADDRRVMAEEIRLSAPSDPK